MLRIHFSAEDLGRIRLATGPDPTWEALLSLHVLGTSGTDPGLRSWTSRVRTTLHSASRPLFHLVPSRGYSPDFLTPAEAVSDPDAAVDTIMSTPQARLRADMALLGRERKLPSWAPALASGVPSARRGLGRALRHYHRQALDPYWTQISASVDAERALRAKAFLAGGTDRLLGGLHPAVRWRAPVLEITYPRDGDLHLQGRGLRLVPSYFCRGTPITLRDDSLAPVLVYPVSQDAGVLRPHSIAARAAALDRLLGRTRAATLLAIGEGESVTGGETARRLGISSASVSEHATVLRDAGLIQSLRVRNTVRHTLTPLGAQLLDGRVQRSGP
ncbi:ArsR/SmtB family transcription factor [Streptomyces sp. 351MFTsu5.1]|uniref:ArsR/SmtB family transcription factor n=1 Tax=Streptomyces sp. 351MFTsu5.1 TaxID=1172180 RepID=UPI0003713FF2|nr:winged helix-turn-helix domain-containing protein [Streptomyces sp. 351MFTsu5.1]